MLKHFLWCKDLDLVFPFSNLFLTDRKIKSSLFKYSPRRRLGTGTGSPKEVVTASSLTEFKLVRVQAHGDTLGCRARSWT